MFRVKTGYTLNWNWSQFLKSWKICYQYTGIQFVCRWITGRKEIIFKFENIFRHSDIFNLQVLCREKKINIIDHRNTITVRHLNGSKLHLYLKGNKVLTEKFTEAVTNILHWRSLLHSLREANDDNYSFHNCGECKATFKRSLMNIKSLKDIRQKNLGKIVIGHLNINVLRQKCDSLITAIKCSRTYSITIAHAESWSFLNCICESPSNIEETFSPWVLKYDKKLSSMRFCVKLQL